MKLDKRIKIFWQILLILSFTSCYDEPVAPIKEGKQVFVYMIADNNLDYFAISDINEMEQGLLNTCNPDGEILVYVDRGNNGSPSHPYLMRIIPDSTLEVVSEILKVYPEQNSTDLDVFTEVLRDVDEITGIPYESRGLVMWSHGNSWLPPEVSLYSDRDKILDTTTVIHSKLKSFGLDENIANSSGYSEMDVIEMGKSLMPYKFDIILFDACFMGAIEVLYELKDVCDFIISSPTEILSAGFPYDQIIPDLLNNDFNAADVAQNKYSFYLKQNGILKSSSVSLVSTHNLELLASFFRNEFSKSVGIVNISQKGVLYNKDSLQQFDRLESEILFDMYDFVSKVCKANSCDNMKKEFDKVWNKSVIMSEHTPFMFGTLSLENCNGLSMYIPQNYDSREIINEYYKKYKWYEDSNIGNVFTDF